MKTIRLLTALALFSTAAACAPGRVLAPQQSAHTFASSLAPAPQQVPLLFVVDGVRFPKDRIPALTSEQVAKVRVLKGHSALREYGPDASYGVVIITTKQAMTPRS